MIGPIASPVWEVCHSGGGSGEREVVVTGSQLRIKVDNVVTAQAWQTRGRITEVRVKQSTTARRGTWWIPASSRVDLRWVALDGVIKSGNMFPEQSRLSREGGIFWVQSLGALALRCGCLFKMLLLRTFLSCFEWRKCLSSHGTHTPTQTHTA